MSHPLKTIAAVCLVAVLTLSLGVRAEDDHKHHEHDKAAHTRNLVKAIHAEQMTLAEALVIIESKAKGTATEAGFKVHDGKLMAWSYVVVDGTPELFVLDVDSRKVTHHEDAKCCGCDDHGDHHGHAHDAACSCGDHDECCGCGEHADHADHDEIKCDCEEDAGHAEHKHDEEEEEEDESLIKLRINLP